MKKIANYSAESFGIFYWDWNTMEERGERTSGAGLLTTPNHTSSAGVLPSLFQKNEEKRREK